MATKRRQLHLAPRFTLPAEYALARTAILATSGAGKSNVAVVVIEELFKASVPFVVIDTKGDYWGTRSNAAGDGPGLPVPIFGGEHGDVPLEPTAGKVMARLVAEKHLSCVLDLSDFDTRAQMFRFLRDFAETLLRLNRHPLHVVAEECDDYLPQKSMGEGGDLAKCLGSWQRLVKRGRQRGIGVTMVSQRAASVNKDALNMATTLIAMGVNAKQDIAAVKDWVVGPYSKPDGEDLALLESLPGLEPGEAWVVSPSEFKVRKRVHFRRRWTFDSGKTPELGEEPLTPSTLADIDISALGEEIAATVERAKADDPAELRAQIAKLQRELADERAKPAPSPEVTVEHVAVRIVPPEIRDLPADLGVRFGAVIGDFKDRADAARDTVQRQVAAMLTDLKHRLDEIPDEEACAVDVADVPRGTARQAVPVPPVAPGAAAPNSDDQGPIDEAMRKVLTVLIQHGPKRTKRQLAQQCGYSAKSSTIRTAVTRLSRRGYVTKSDPVELLEPGRLIMGGCVEPLPTGPALLEYWLGEVDQAMRVCLTTLVERYPGDATKEELAEIGGYEPTSSTIRTALTRLRRLGLVDAREVRADADFIAAIR